jgi:hypothetical protein
MLLHLELGAARSSCLYFCFLHLAALNSHGLAYSTPSLPHTGLYSLEHMDMLWQAGSPVRRQKHQPTTNSYNSYHESVHHHHLNFTSALIFEYSLFSRIYWFVFSGKDFYTAADSALLLLNIFSKNKLRLRLAKFALINVLLLTKIYSSKIYFYQNLL